VCWTHRGTGSAIVHALKYGGWHAVAREIGDRVARLGPPAAGDAPVPTILPVPLSESRARERGFNQSERIARSLAARWSAPLRLDVLERVRATETQTRLTPEERLANVSGAFRARDSAREALRSAHVVLVDDVVTTAATLNACAAGLHAGGARFISYVTFGRAPAPGDR
jgi:ComF family protein